MLSFISPFILTSILLDLTKKTAIVLVIVASVLALVSYGLITTGLESSLDLWMQNTRHLEVLMTASLCAILVIILATRNRERQLARSLSWSSSINQTEMQKLCTSHLQQQGWSVTFHASFAAISVYVCRKNEQKMFAVFIRQSDNISIALNNMKKIRGVEVSQVVIVTFDNILPTLATKIIQEGLSAINYKDLGAVEEVCEAANERRLAARKRR